VTNRGAIVRSWDRVPAEAVLPGITRWVVDGERQTLVRYRYEPGSVFPVHAHPEEQITAILSGQIEFVTAGTTQLLVAGDIAVLPGGTEHGAHVVGDEPVETLNALAPRRPHPPTFPGRPER
jgi:quercetin dioxygenase-like cupin family protein